MYNNNVSRRRTRRGGVVEARLLCKLVPCVNSTLRVSCCAKRAQVEADSTRNVVRCLQHPVPPVLGQCCLRVPGPLADPADRVAGVDADSNGGGFRCLHRFAHRLHQVLRVAHQHLGRLLILVRTWRQNTTHYPPSINYKKTTSISLDNNLLDSVHERNIAEMYSGCEHSGDVENGGRFE